MKGFFNELKSIVISCNALFELLPGMKSAVLVFSTILLSFFSTALLERAVLGLVDLIILVIGLLLLRNEVLK